jgi:uncharacterized membrane protein YoaK (UPF0700 family)
MDPLGIIGTIRDIKDTINDITDAVSRWRNAPMFVTSAVVEVGCYSDIMDEVEAEIKTAKPPNHRLRSIKILLQSILKALQKLKMEVNDINPWSYQFKFRCAFGGIQGEIQAALQELGYKTTLVTSAVSSFTRQVCTVYFGRKIRATKLTKWVGNPL